MARILIFDEKHAKLYYDITSGEQRAKAFLDVLRSRFKSGYYYYEPVAPDTTLSAEDQEIIELTEHQISLLPTTLRETMETKKKRMESRISRAQREYELEKKFWDDLINILALPEEEAVLQGAQKRYGFVSTAESIIEARSDYQYEGYEIEDTLN